MVLLIQFYNDQDWIEFRDLELRSLLQLHGVTDRTIHLTSSMLYLFDINLSHEILQKICRRSVLIKHIYQLIASHPFDIHELINNVQQANY